MSEQQKESQKGDGRGLILVVEDDDFLKKLITQRLEHEGFKAEGVPEGKAALEFLKKTTPILVVLDLLLPGVDGFQVLQEIRENQRLKGLPVIVLSNLGEQEHINRAKMLGADDYLVKAHFTLGEIMEKINKLISKKYL